MQEIEIGTKFVNRTSKRKDVETVIDIYKTYNSKGELVKTRYVCAHDFLGQQVVNHDVLKTTILRGLIQD